jgi:hypothetical protein
MHQRTKIASGFAGAAALLGGAGAAALLGGAGVPAATNPVVIRATLPTRQGNSRDSGAAHPSTARSCVEDRAATRRRYFWEAGAMGKKE